MVAAFAARFAVEKRKNLIRGEPRFQSLRTLDERFGSESKRLSEPFCFGVENKLDDEAWLLAVGEHGLTTGRSTE
jgi:hypothetical protein